MAEGDGAAADVDALWIEIESANARDALSGKGLVELDGVEVRRAQTRSCQELLRRWNRPLTHVVRIHACRCARDPAKFRFDAELFDDRFARKEYGRGAVVQRGRIARRY